jgi:hypothetical protein
MPTTKNDVQVHHVYVHADRELLQRLDSIDQAVASLTEEVQEVLRDRQSQLDAATQTLTDHNRDLQQTVDASRPSSTKKNKE